MRAWPILLLLGLAACGDGDAEVARDAGDPAALDAGSDAALADGALDAATPPACTASGNLGQCITVTACAAMPGHTSTPGLCPGPADIQCCALTPNVMTNPPTPVGWKPMTQPEVTPDMTAWAVEILHDPVTYPMFATAIRTFGTLMVLARVEWHVPDFQNHVVHRGVTLYEPR